MVEVTKYRKELYIFNNTSTDFAASVYEYLRVVQKLGMSNAGRLWCGYDSYRNCLPKHVDTTASKLFEDNGKSS